MVNNVTAFGRVSNKMTVSETHRLVEEYAEIRVIVHMRSRQLMITGARRQLVEHCTEVNAADINGGSDERSGSDIIPAKLGSHSTAIIASRMNVGAEPPLIYGDVLKLTVGKSKAADGRLEKWKDA